MIEETPGNGTSSVCRSLTDGGLGSLTVGRIPSRNDHPGSSPNEFNGGRLADPRVAPGEKHRPTSDIPGSHNHVYMILGTALTIGRIKELSAAPLQYFCDLVREC